MKSQKLSEVPVACDLTSFNSDQIKRHEALLGELLASIRSSHELSNGYELHLPSDDRWYLKLAELVSLERQCCPFLSFEQGFSNDGDIWLRLTGDENAKQFLETILDPIVRDKQVVVKR